MAEFKVLDIKGAPSGSVQAPKAFEEEVRTDIIERAVVAENSMDLQPQGHYIMAGMNTTARYYGAMSSYRTGRHMGIAIRPRQKLGGGRQGDVRKIPSATKGRRAHPHVIEKTLMERINRKEYQKALRSAIAGAKPMVISDAIEAIKKTKDMAAFFVAAKLGGEIERSKSSMTLRKGQRRLSTRRRARKAVLLVVNDDKGAVKAARNMPGVDACSLSGMKVRLFAPGGVPGRTVVWSESAIKNVDAAIEKAALN